jgi:hypothetical protein
MSPRFLNEDINTPEILKLTAMLWTILKRRPHQPLTSVPEGRGVCKGHAAIGEATAGECG